MRFAFKVQKAGAKVGSRSQGSSRFWPRALNGQSMPSKPCPQIGTKKISVHKG